MISIADSDIREMFERSFGPIADQGWHPKLRWSKGYFTPEEWYQTIVDRLVNEQTVWLDVGGGKSVFPHNLNLSMELADRCKLLVGLDPSPNIEQNQIVHERIRGLVEDLPPDRQYHLATMRMVAEHIVDPIRSIDVLSQSIKVGGYVVIHTPSKYSVMSLLAKTLPDNTHGFFTRLLTPGRLDEDVFPTTYRMNTRKDLRQLFEKFEFDEVFFKYAPDATLFHRSRILSTAEILACQACRILALPYPENNIVGVYQKRTPVKSEGNRSRQSDSMANKVSLGNATDG